MIVAAGFVASSEAIIRLKVVPTHNDYKYRDLFLGAKSPNAIFGDSHAAYSLIGLDDFVNLAYPGNSFLSISGRVRLYFRHRTPNKVILQAGPHHFSRDFLNWRPDDVEDFEKFLKGRSPWALKLFENIHRQEVFRYWAMIVYGGEFVPSHEFLPDGSRLEKGLYTRIPPDIQRAGAARTLRILEPVPGFEDTRVAAEYGKTIDFLQSKGAQVCLVTLPVVALLRAGIAEFEAYRRAQKFFEDLARSRGMKYLNLGTWELPDELFADAHHLNAVGGRAISDDVLKGCFG